jgi:hypothetical protein
MGIPSREFEKDTWRMTFWEARERTETSTRNVNLRVEYGGALQKGQATENKG